MMFLSSFHPLLDAKEVNVPHWESFSTIEGIGFKVGNEKILVTLESSDVDRDNHKELEKTWGWETRIELDPSREKNRYLVEVLITVNNTQFVVPQEHLSDLFNLSSNRLSIKRNVETNSLEVTITGGQGPGGYDVTFCFVAGKYTSRKIAYIAYDAKLGMQDATKTENYKLENKSQ